MSKNIEYASKTHCLISYLMQIRLNALACIDKLLDSLDKMMILDEVLPFLTNINCQDVDIIMSVIGNRVMLFTQSTITVRLSCLEIKFFFLLWDQDRKGKFIPLAFIVFEINLSNLSIYFLKEPNLLRKTRQLICPRCIFYVLLS